MNSFKNVIEIEGARVHNLKNINLKIPRDKLVVITGLSGSGKSSLAFDTIYAEGQRRYIETFSAYARQFLGNLERPDIDKIEGLSPVIAIEQKTISKNPRSTVGTMTEIYDFLRLLFARISNAYSIKTNKKMKTYNENQIVELILKKYENHRITLLAPIVQSRKGHYRELFENLMKKGFVSVRVDSKILPLEKGMKVDRYKTHDIELVIDTLDITRDEKSTKRLIESIKIAMNNGNSNLLVIDDKNKVSYFSKHLMCPDTGISYPNPEPNTFSFNSPKGMCPKCKGLGLYHKVNTKKIIPDPSISIQNGGIIPLGSYKNTWAFNQLDAIAKKYNFKLITPINKIPEEAMKIILRGGKEKFSIVSKEIGITKDYHIDYEGIENFIENQFKENDSMRITRWAEEFMDKVTCDDCNGSRLKKESLFFKITNKNIFDLTKMDLDNLMNWIVELPNELSEKEYLIGEEIIKELKTRIQFLLDVGLNYLSLNRVSSSLSGGESQRIRLATQIGSQLVGVLYILDEPSIGLHQKDNKKLIQSLKSLRDIGNSIIVVEHDKEMIENADYLIDIGPHAGKNGGKVVFSGTSKNWKNTNTITTNYLNGLSNIIIPKNRRKGTKEITLTNCSGNNLKNITVSFPLEVMIAVTGVSGSGKSTLINNTLYPILNSHFFNGVKKPLPYEKIEGLENIDKVISINQSPIGRTPRSNPATYTGVFSEIRNLFSIVQEAKVRGYKAGRFSFNVTGGRCETCKGGGLKKIEMNFLPDVYVLCELCQGKRFNRETLDIRYKGKSINDVLEMTINQACLFFKDIPKIFTKLKTIQDVGLGYIALGQSATTLSGGEAQRIKLATELSKKSTGKTFYILDEPTTGLHFEDIKVLMKILDLLVQKGNTVVIIEHNLDVIKMADYIIDLGYDGGKNGGEIIVTGTPEEIMSNTKSHTAKFLKEELV